ncbi:MAG: hypothetical protein IPI18_20220 [Saprospiraceae bacterium]|nr:hypothetical protein [Saprospiraceae bacterium]
MKRHNDLPISQVLKQWSQSPKFKPRLIQEKSRLDGRIGLGKPSQKTLKN